MILKIASISPHFSKISPLREGATPSRSYPHSSLCASVKLTVSFKCLQFTTVLASPLAAVAGAVRLSFSLRNEMCNSQWKTNFQPLSSTKEILPQQLRLVFIREGMLTQKQENYMLFCDVRSDAVRPSSPGRTN